MTLILFLTGILVMAWQTRKPKRLGAREADRGASVDAETRQQQGGWRTVRGDDLPSQPHLQGTFVPTTGLLYSNAPEAFPFENAFAKGSFLPLHRPTFDKALDKSGKYPYGGHFGGKKRLWEMRLQFQTKVVPTEPMFFGIQLEEYVPLSFTATQAMSATVAALKKAVGKDVHHSPGDNPAKVSGEKERPTFVMPLWAFDQVIETPEGETPPDLTDPNMDKLGTKRTDNRSAFIKRFTDFRFKPGVTYTLCFWGISQWLDNIQWQLQGIVPGGLHFNKFCGKPPVYVVLYTLKPRMPAQNEEDSKKVDRRHLDSYKNYYLHMAFWSSQVMPPKRRAAELLQGAADQTGAEVELRKKKKKWYGLSKAFQSVFACCVPAYRHK
jgi:hypothetical protein